MFKIFSFFSGAGFLDLGFEKTPGFTIVFANEIQKDFAYAYQYSRQQMGINPPKYGLCQEDIKQFLLDPQKLQKLKWQMRDERAMGGE